MDLDELKSTGRIIFESVAGSHAYGLNNADSDEDIKGIYLNPQSAYLGLETPELQISDDNNDVTYYSLKRFFELAQEANPNIIEMLWYPNDCIRVNSTVMQKLIACRDFFITKRAYFTHAKYAESQIKKAKGKNKKVHNPQPEEMPKREDFCWVIEKWEGLMIYADHKHATVRIDDSVFPCRPKSLKDSDIDLSHCHVASLEHAENVFRLYDYGYEAKGVFRGDMLVPESIPIKDEFRKFIGLLIYSHNAYEKALKEWHSYWDWKNNRNEARWIDQEKGILTYDQKNMMHCLRLLMAGESILTQGFPLVRVEGQQKEYLMKVRNGEFEYEHLMADVNDRMKRLDYLYSVSELPEECDFKKVDALYRGLSK